MPPPLPPFWPEDIFQGEGVGGVYFEAPPAAGFLYAPLQQLKQRVFSKRALEETALVVRRGSMRVRQGDAWFKTLAGVTLGGLKCTLHFRGPQKTGGQISEALANRYCANGYSP